MWNLAVEVIEEDFGFYSIEAFIYSLQKGLIICSLDACEFCNKGAVQCIVISMRNDFVLNIFYTYTIWRNNPIFFNPLHRISKCTVPMALLLPPRTFSYTVKALFTFLWPKWKLTVAN